MKTATLLSVGLGLFAGWFGILAAADFIAPEPAGEETEANG